MDFGYNMTLCLPGQGDPMENVPQGHNGLIIFSDFDGTIAVKDVGNRLFYHFSDGRSEEPVARWRRDEIDSRQCLEQEARLMRDVTEAEVYEFVDRFERDPGFAGFVSLCREYALPLYILSDGLDLYVRRLLDKSGMDGIPVMANQAKVENSRLVISWPHFAQSCGRCGNCKGYHLRRLKQPGRLAVYIGDGKSDLCAVPEADVIFAKGDLAEFCRREDIDFLPFNDFSAISQMLKARFLKSTITPDLEEETP